jgi:hypothetical protein
MSELVERLMKEATFWDGSRTHSGERVTDLLREAATALAARLPDREGWRPIETAPKDRRIWVWGRGHGLAGGFTWQGVSCWDDVFPQMYDPRWGFLPSGVIPEYWRELPAPPDHEQQSDK